MSAEHNNDSYAVDKMQHQLELTFGMVNEAKHNSELVVLDNGYSLIGIPSNVKCKYTLTWCMEHADSADEFVDVIQDNILSTAALSMTDNDRDKLKRHYNLYRTC